MAAIVQGKKETYGDGHLPEDLHCIECGNLVKQKKVGGRILSGGFHLGLPDIFLCAYCARESDLHILGYLIGDAIVSDYNVEWGALQYRVQNVMRNLERSVLRAIVHQLQYRLRTI